ncbi:MAG: hypothetical protein ACRC67_36535, partial [Inquilinus sp.]|uniref:hypothetical protein n=1 Tax=Inquilinus sp. TaxID=1932117 RepID=UPI003F2FBDAB
RRAIMSSVIFGSFGARLVSATKPYRRTADDHPALLTASYTTPWDTTFSERSCGFPRWDKGLQGGETGPGSSPAKRHPNKPFRQLDFAWLSEHDG